MAVDNSEIVRYRRFNGYADPRLPEGYWMGSVTSNGDATGGSHALRLIYALATDLFLNTRMYSLEVFNLASNTQTAQNGRLTVTNLGGRNLEQSLVHQTRLETETEQVGATMNARDLVGIRRIFLGSQLTAASQADISVIMPNNDGITWVLQAEGYWWGQRSVLADGGPQRPPSGLYGA